MRPWNNRTRFRLPTRLLAMCLAAVILALAGCAQHEGMPTSEDGTSGDQHLPFDATSDKGGIFPTDSLSPAAIPAGTPLAVHLVSALSSATARPGDTFEAVLDEPISIRGRMVALRGSKVAGKVVDARAASEVQEAGYLRLALTAVVLNGQSVPIQTSSIFVKRGSHQGMKEEPNSSVVVGSVPGGVAGAGRSRAGSAALIGASTTTGYASQVGTVDGTENRGTWNTDVGVSANRRLSFRLAQPLPLGS